MQIVIDIPENVYKYLKQEWVKVPEDDSVINQIMHGILYGTVLPEKHGDLIDRNVVYAEFNNAGLSRKEMIGKLLVFGIPTVIPADKENSDADSN